MTGVCLQDSKMVPQKHRNIHIDTLKNTSKSKKYTQNNTQNANKYTQKYCFIVYLSLYGLEPKQYLLHYRLD